MAAPTNIRSAAARCRTNSPHVNSPGRGDQPSRSGGIARTNVSVRRRMLAKYSIKLATRSIIDGLRRGESLLPIGDLEIRRERIDEAHALDDRVGAEIFAEDQVVYIISSTMHLPPPS